MFPDNNILDIIISITLIYALLSILVSILLEWWNHYKKERARFLRLAIGQLLNDPLNLNFAELFYNHYLVDGLRNKQMKRSPQYISSQLFAEVLIDIIANRKLHDKPIKMTGESGLGGKQYAVLEQPSDKKVQDRFKEMIGKLNPSPFTDTILAFCEKSNGDYDKLKSLLSFWYDDYMDRVGGWYKASIQKKLMWFALLVTLMLNIDSIHIIRTLGIDDRLRNNLVQTAERVADEYSMLSDSAKQSTAELEKIVTKVFPDSVIQRAREEREYRHALLLQHANTRLGPYVVKLDSMIKSDSATQVFQNRANRVLDVTSSLELPIGWDRNLPPISWFSKPEPLVLETEELRAIPNKSLVAYADARNELTLKNLILYLLGMGISVVSLSFGAPFWFETLVKLVNIRRSGKRPEQVNK